MKYALALGGGGARGAFEAGVWRALNEMNKDIAAIAGTSIGAINGAAFVSGADAEQLWLSLEPGDMILNAADENLMSAKALTKELRGIFSGGLDTSPLRRLLKSIISEEKVRTSDIDYGLCTYSAAKKKSVEMFCDKIPPGELIDYILASACFPAFKPVRINHEEFADGGIQNNIPEDMLINRGYDAIISVSTGVTGVVRPVAGRGVNIINIKYPNPKQGIMNFDKKLLRRGMEYGYLECMKAFGAYSGERFFIDSASYGRAIYHYGSELISGIEEAAQILELDSCRSYTFTELVKAVLALYPTHPRLSGSVADIEKNPSRLITVNHNIYGKTFRAANSIVYIKCKK